MPNFLVTLENEKTGTFPKYISTAPSFEECYKYEKGVIKRLQKIRPHIKLLTLEKVPDDYTIQR